MVYGGRMFSNRIKTYFSLVSLAVLFLLFQNFNKAHVDKSPDTQIVFQSSRKSNICYRIPTLVTWKSKYVAAVEKRYSWGKKFCNDDGNSDLVMKISSDNGKTWSKESAIVTADFMRKKMRKSGSIFFDPSYPKNGSTNDFYIKTGNHSMATTNDGTMVVTFSVTYNIVPGEVNSPDNMKLGKVKSRYFRAVSTDGVKWEIRRIHDDIYRSCSEKLVSDSALKDALLKLYPQENYRKFVVPLRKDIVKLALTELKVKDSANLEKKYSNFDEKYDSFLKYLFEKHGITKAKFVRRYHSLLVSRVTSQLTVAIMSTLSQSEKATRIASLLEVPLASVEEHMFVLKMLFQEDSRNGPGNSVVFPLSAGAGAEHRLFVPAAPLSFYQDNPSNPQSPWVCADTTKTTKGGERQPAWLGGSRLVMSLRTKEGVDNPDYMYRRFSVSSDAGETWTQANYIKINGDLVLPDAISNGGIVSLQTGNDRYLVTSHLSNNEKTIPGPNPGSIPDDRRMLTLTTFEPDSLTPILSEACPDTQVYKSQYTVWENTAGYSVLAHLDGADSLGVLFEATDDSGSLLNYRGWTEAVRFTLVPLEALTAGNPIARCQ